MRTTERILRSPELVDLCEAQDGIVAFHQLTDLGLDRRVVHRRVDDQWQLVGPHVVALHNGPLNRRQQWWAGVLHAGPGGALAGLTALEADGLRGISDDVVHAVATAGRGRRDLDTEAVTIQVQEARSLGSAVWAARRPPRLRAEEATLDAASRARSDNACRAVIAASVQQRLTHPSALEKVAATSLRLPRRRLIVETIGDVAGGSHSLPELAWLRGLREFRFPEPSRQSVVKRPNGRYFLDSRFDRWRVAVEVNGIQHLELLASEADDERRLNLSAGGLLVVDLSSYLVRHELGVAMLRTGRALHSRGWEPVPYTRSRLTAVAEQRHEPLWLPSAA